MRSTNFARTERAVSRGMSWRRAIRAPRPPRSRPEEIALGASEIVIAASPAVALLQRSATAAFIVAGGVYGRAGVGAARIVERASFCGYQRRTGCSDARRLGLPRHAAV